MIDGTLTGIVKWFDSKKGFGFIESQGKDYFVHFKSIAMPGYKELTEKQHVMFTPTKGNKGMMADNVMVINAV